MANELETQIIDALNQTAAVIRANMQAKGINASGRTADSLRARKYVGGFQLVGGASDTAPFETVEVGRKPGKIPYEFATILEEWSRAKGLQFEDEEERRKFARALAYKIKHDGTKRNANHVDVYSTAVNNAASTIRDICTQHVRSALHAAVGGVSGYTSVTTSSLHF